MTKFHFTALVLASVFADVLSAVGSLERKDHIRATSTRERRAYRNLGRGRGKAKAKDKGKGGKKEIDDETSPPIEELNQPSGSNDDSFLMHICSLFAEFETIQTESATDATDVCADLDPSKYLLCPDWYESEQVCNDGGTSPNALLYCAPLFASLIEEPVVQTRCINLCMEFVDTADCCDLVCP